MVAVLVSARCWTPVSPCRASAAGVLFQILVCVFSVAVCLFPVSGSLFCFQASCFSVLGFFLVAGVARLAAGLPDESRFGLPCVPLRPHGSCFRSYCDFFSGSVPVFLSRAPLLASRLLVFRPWVVFLVSGVPRLDAGPLDDSPFGLQCVRSQPQGSCFKSFCACLPLQCACFPVLGSFSCYQAPCFFRSWVVFLVSGLPRLAAGPPDCPRHSLQCASFPLQGS